MTEEICAKAAAETILQFLGAIFGLWIFLKASYLTWIMQIKFGNFLKHHKPNSWIRKVWWSMCDQERGCEFCSAECKTCGWINNHQKHDPTRTKIQ